jgi:protease-4
MRVFAGLALVLLCACGPSETEERRERARVVREIVLDHPPAESPERSLFSSRGATVQEVIDAVDRAREDERVTGLFLRVGPFEGAWGRVGDLLEAFQAFRETDKPIHCYLEAADNAGYALAARACDRISMTPAGMLDTVGIAAHAFFARRLLDSIGVRADVLQVGRFKGAAEPVMRDEMSPELRESLGALVDDIHADLIDALVTGRGIEAPRAQEILDQGPYDSARAREANLVDDVAFDDEARAHVRREANADRIDRVRFGPEEQELDLEAILSALSGGAEDEETHGSRLALVHMTGTIVDAEEDGQGTGRSGPFVRHMRALADDDEVRAVVLRIDSPGGSALASDRMWHAVRRCAAKKPVIVSLGDTAASGGYYIATAGTVILAHPTSVVGSIGVIGGKADLSSLFSRVGVSAEIISRGANAGWSTPTRGFTEGERRVLIRSMRSTYRRFVRRVADGRGMEREAVEAIAEGRVWSGRRGLELGLVDQAGGLRAAIALARERGELDDDAPIDMWPREQGVLQILGQLLSGGPEGAATELIELATTVEPFGTALELARAFSGREHMLLTLPFVLDVR